MHYTSPHIHKSRPPHHLFSNALDNCKCTQQRCNLQTRAMIPTSQLTARLKTSGTVLLLPRAEALTTDPSFFPFSVLHDDIQCATWRYTACYMTIYSVLHDDIQCVLVYLLSIHLHTSWSLSGEIKFYSWQTKFIIQVKSWAQIN